MLIKGGYIDEVMANTMKPSADETLKHLESLKSSGAHIIKTIINVIKSSLEAEDLQEQMNKVCLLNKKMSGKNQKLYPYVAVHFKSLILNC